MKKNTAALLSFVIMTGISLSYTNAEAVSIRQKRVNETQIQEAIQTRQNNFFRNELRRELGIKNTETLKAYHNQNIWKSYVTRRSTQLSREGELMDRDGIRENNGYVDAANNTKTNSKKSLLCYYVFNQAPGEDCYTMGQIDGAATGRISTRMERMREADVAAIYSAVRDLNKAAMYIEKNEDAEERPSNYTPGNSQRYYKSPYQKRFTIPTDLDI